MAESGQLNKRPNTCKIKKMTNDIEWKKVKLGDVGIVSMCKRIMKEQTSETGEIPFYKIGTFGTMPDAYISKNLFEEYKEKYSFPKKGSVLISAAGTIGRAVIYNGEPAYFQDSNIVWLEHDETKVLNRYLYYLYKITHWHTTSGGVIERLYNDNIIKTEIPIPCKNGVPDLEAQRQIAQKLSDMDSLIAAKEKLLAKKRNLKVAAMQHLIKDNEGENWKKVKLGEVFTIKHGYGFEGEFFSNENNNKVVLTSGNFKIEGGFQSQDTPIFYLGNYPLSFNLKPNDLVVTMTDLSKNSDTLGNPLLIPNDGVQYLHNQRIGLIKFLDDSYDKDFIFWLLCTKKYHNSIVATAAGSTVKHTSPKRICSIDVFVPTSKNEQRRIASILSDMDSEIAAIQKEIAKLLNLKTAMMQKMFCFTEGE